MPEQSAGSDDMIRMVGWSLVHRHNRAVGQGFVDRLDKRGVRLRWWLGTRGLVLVIAAAMLLHPEWQHLFNDLKVYQHWGSLLAQGQVPSDDPMWQYPPLAAFVFGGIGLLGGQPWMYAALFVVADVAVSVLLANDARRRGRWHGFAVWLAAPLLLGPIMYGRYDVIPTAFALAGMLALALPAAAGALLAVGGALKVWPAVLAVALGTRDWLRGAVGAAAAAAGVVALSAWAFPTVISGFLSNGEARGLQTESVAALPFVWARLILGGDAAPAVFRYGSSEVGHPWADAIAPKLLPLTGVGLLLLVALRAFGRLGRVPPADIAFVVVLWLMGTSRVLSPQFNVWLVGMAALVWAAGSPQMRRATVPVAVTALTAQALYPFVYMHVVQGEAAGVLLHTLRIAALLIALGMAVRVLYVTASEPAVVLDMDSDGSAGDGGQAQTEAPGLARTTE